MKRLIFEIEARGESLSNGEAAEMLRMQALLLEGAGRGERPKADGINFTPHGVVRWGGAVDDDVLG